MKLFRLFSVLLLIIASTQGVWACKCKPTELTIVECRKFDLIFKCKIEAVTDCQNNRSIAEASILELYKGELTEKVNFSYDCASSCLMSFSKNETWLIYAKKNAQDQFEVSLCDRNRMLFIKPEEDYYFTNTDISFEDEISYLKKNIGLKLNNTNQSKPAIDITQRENNDTSGINKLALLFMSLVLFLGVYLIANKFIK